MMRAIVFTKYGPPDVLHVKEVDVPAPKDNEVLIKVFATTVSAGDCEIRGFKIPGFLWLPIRIFIGLFRPRKQILGQEFAGEIESAGQNVKAFTKGDKIFGFSGFGAYAEYLCLPEDSALALKPATVSSEEAAAVPLGGLNTLYFLRKAHIKKGQEVLINGAGGSIGTIAVQYVKNLGARVTAIDSADKLNMLRTIGADNVIDFTKEDFTKSGRTYDVIFDVAGKASYSGSIKSLKKNGTYALANLKLSQILRSLFIPKKGGRKVIFGMAGENKEDLQFLAGLIESGKIKPVIDRRYPFDEVAEAHRYVETGEKKGNVIITVLTDK